MANLKVDVEVNQMLHGIHVHFSKAGIQSCNLKIKDRTLQLVSNQQKSICCPRILTWFLRPPPQFWRKITSFKPSQVSPISQRSWKQKLAPNTSDTWKMLQFTFSSPQRLNIYSTIISGTYNGGTNNLMFGYLGGVSFPLHKPYPNSLYRWGFLHFRYLKCLVIQGTVYFQKGLLRL